MCRIEFDTIGFRQMIVLGALFEDGDLATHRIANELDSEPTVGK